MRRAFVRLRESEGPRFDQFFAVYRSSMPPREQRSKQGLHQLIARGDYRVFLFLEGEMVLGYSVVFMPRGQSMALLEYMGTRAERRNAGLGALIFAKSAAKAAGRFLLIEADSDREAAADRPIRTRRKAFYRRLGCRQISGLDYLFALPGKGPPPVMDLLVLPPPGRLRISKAMLRGWLQAIFIGAYAQAADDERIDRMMAEVGSPVGLDAR